MSWRAVPVPTEDRSSWLAARRDGIGASDVAAIVGLSPWRSAYQVWADKVKGYEQDDNEGMYWGRMMEDAVAARFAEERPEISQIEIGLVHHADYPWVMATCDRLAAESNYQPGDDLRLAAIGVIEIKTDPGFGKWDEGIPDHYQAQVQWQLLTTGLEHAWVPVLHGGRRFEVYELSADSRAQQALFDKAEAFYEEHVKTGEPPEVDGSAGTARVLSDLWTPTSGSTTEVTAQSKADLRQLVALKEQAKGLNAEIGRLENRIKAELEDTEVGLIDGVAAVSWKERKVKGYWREPSEYRAFTILKGAKS